MIEQIIGMNEADVLQLNEPAIGGADILVRVAVMTAGPIHPLHTAGNTLQNVTEQLDSPLNFATT